MFRFFSLIVAVLALAEAHFRLERPRRPEDLVVLRLVEKEPWRVDHADRLVGFHPVDVFFDDLGDQQVVVARVNRVLSARGAHRAEEIGPEALVLVVPDIADAVVDLHPVGDDLWRLVRGAVVVDDEFQRVL